MNCSVSTCSSLAWAKQGGSARKLINASQTDKIPDVTIKLKSLLKGVRI